MAQVTARIVVSQVDNPAPGGYSHGSRDGLALDALISLTNLDNAGVTSWQWEVIPAVGLEVVDYGVTGLDTSTCALTPPASTGYGDLAVRLTVRGDPLPGGKANVAEAVAILGVRAPLSGYGDGLPIPHMLESLRGGVVTLSAVRGVIGRIAEAIRAFKIAGPGGGGGGELSGDVTGPTSSTTVGKLRGYAVDFNGDPPIHGGLLVGEEVAPGDVRIRQIASPPDDPPVMLIGAGMGPPSWGSYFPDFFAFDGIVGGNNGLSFGASQRDVAGSGTITLLASQLVSGTIRLAGALTGDRVVQLPALPGMRVMFCNETTGAYALRIESVNGGSTYLLPGQRRMLHQDAYGVLVGEAMHVLEYAKTISLAGDAIGDHTTTLFALPAGCIVDRCEVVTLASPVGGRSESSVGTNASTYDDVIAKTDTPALGVDPLGKAATTLGSAMSGDGCAFFGTAKTVSYNHKVTSATVTAGSIRVHAIVRYVGA